jgi:ADP-dependent NAD(P)H-hydrate dehydratase / NAD(P)H-hydrate epimerase
VSVQRVIPSNAECPLFDAAQTQRIELRERAGLPPHTLMARAGDAVARLALAVAPHAQRVWVAAGPGNNGGDGLEAAALLCRAGRQVEVSLLGDATALPEDAREALARAQAAGVRIVVAPGESTFAATLGAHDLAIDALLGIGATRPPQGALAESVRQLNALACPVLAVDVPSGLHVGSGWPLGEDCVVATHTVSLLTLKPGLFTGAGRDHAGTVWFDALGVNTSADEPGAWLSASEAEHASSNVRRHAQHKGSFGDVAVVGGAPGMAGAALLAARAAHAAGAGRVFVEMLGPEAPALNLDPLRPELMFRHGWTQGATEALAQTTVVCGCGGGDAVRAPLPRLLSLAARLVLDADALNALAADPSLATLLVARARRHFGTVLTPHPLEAARLLGGTTAEVQADRLLAARTLADRFHCVVVLKGSGSIVAAPGQVSRINATGNASLSSAGTGDVLAGWLGGRWAQRSSATPFTVAVEAVAEHGAAARAHAFGPMRAGDLIEAMHQRLG